jgi:hypothetical protein
MIMESTKWRWNGISSARDRIIDRMEYEKIIFKIDKNIV